MADNPNISGDSLYASLGVSSKKEDVSAAIEGLPLGAFPGAFCKAIDNPFPFFEDSDLLYLSHADGTGTKSSLAYLYWKETGDISVFSDLMQDAMVMNTDDLLCVGVQDHFYFSSTIGRNKYYIPGEVIKELIEGQQRNIEFLQSLGIQTKNLGGETADMGDVIRTLVVDMTATTFISRSDFIDTSKIKPDHAIVGLASFGQASYENTYNSGIGSNGLTLARHEVLATQYKDIYPESYDPSLRDLVYRGRRRVEDRLPIAEKTSEISYDHNDYISYGKALLSPTRTYLPILRKVFSEKIPIQGIIHLTGGGQVKSIKFGNHLHFIKDKLFKLPPLFEELAQTIGLKELFSVFNAGHRMEIYTEQKYAQEIIDISKSFKVDAKVVGYTEFSDSSNKLTLSYQGQVFHF